MVQLSPKIQPHQDSFYTHVPVKSMQRSPNLAKTQVKASIHEQPGNKWFEIVFLVCRRQLAATT